MLTPLIIKYINNIYLEKENINNYLTWQNIIDIIKIIIDQSYFHKVLICEKISNDLDKINDTEKAIALFPLVIYYYENTDKLERELDYLYQSKLLNINLINGLKILTAIAHLVIQKQIKPEQISKQLKEKLQIETEEELKIIAIIEQHINQKSPLTQVENTLSTMTNSSDLGIYQALYSFLSMPNNLPVSLSRSSQFSKQTRETTILTGNSFPSISLRF